MLRVDVYLKSGEVLGCVTDRYETVSELCEQFPSSGRFWLDRNDSSFADEKYCIHIEQVSHYHVWKRG